MKIKTSAILLAGGKGTRFDPDNLKTLYKKNNMTLVEMVIRDIIKSNLFDEIVLVYNSDYKNEFIQIANNLKIKYTKNGSSRFLSAYNGAKEASNNKLLFIDVAAPFYEHKMFKKMLNKLDNFDGVMSTVLDGRADHIIAEGDIVKKVFKRGEILRVKSYQAVKRDIWLKIVKSKNNTSHFTEMLSVLIDEGKSVGNVISENNPRKITTKKDLIFLTKHVNDK